MKRLAIVSSYDILCGNASYTEALRREFSKHYNVEILKLDVSLLSSKALKHTADKHIKELTERLQEFDYVNIQFEAGLFGSNKNTIYSRVASLIQASNNLILTMHRYDAKTTLDLKGVIRQIAKFQWREAFRNIVKNYRYNRFCDLYKNVILLCKKQDAAIMVHTERDQKLISRLHRYEHVYEHPLTFLSKEMLEHYKSSISKTQFLKKYGLTDSHKTIGIFGFISPYKGHDIAIKAMRHLPENYVLLIFGVQHPMSIAPNQSAVEPYIEKLISLIGEYKLYNNVKFCGSLDDDDFIRALIQCDFSVLPYFEVNQGGSGNAALTLETHANSIFSQNLAFLELSKYAPRAFPMFSIGNYLELAHAIQSYDKNAYTQQLNAYYDKYNIHTNIELHKKLFEKQERK